MRYSLCIEPLFLDVPIQDRVKIAKDIGYDAVEFWNPFAHDIEELQKAIAKSDIPVSVMALADNWGVRLSEDFENVEKAAQEAVSAGKDLGCSCFIGLSGDISSKYDTEKGLLISNLQRLSELFEKNDVTLVLEPLNSTHDHKGYYLDSSHLGFEIIRRVNSPAVKVLFDIYHMQIMEGNIIETVTKNIGHIGHFHSAGVPGRSELSSGELNYAQIIPAIDKTGYNKYFGLEYWPRSEDHLSSARKELEFLRSCV